MSLWGASTTDESKPKHLSDAEKRDCYADNTGWTVPAGGNDNPAALRETLVTIGGLSGATNLVEASISSSRLVTTALGAAAGGDFSAEIIYNELVTVTGTPQVTVTSTGANHTLDYASGSGTNRLTFTSTIAANAAAENDVRSIAAGNIALNSGTIQDAETNVDSGLTHGAGTTTITVAA
jgi:hypothetical protein